MKDPPRHVVFLGLRRWWARTFRTRVTPSLYNPHAGRVLTEEEWTAQDEEILPEPGWKAERPAWWEWGSSYGVTAGEPDEAVRRLDEWMDKVASQETA